MSTTIKRNRGSDVVLDLKFYGPPDGAQSNLGPTFDLTAWTLRVIDAHYSIENEAVVTFTDAAEGEARVSFQGAGSLPLGNQDFRLQLVSGSDFEVGFPVIQLQIGDYNVADFAAEPPYLLLSGRDGVQMTVEPAEPDIIFGPASALLLESGDYLLLESGDKLLLEVA